MDKMFVQQFTTTKVFNLIFNVLIVVGCYTGPKMIYNHHMQYAFLYIAFICINRVFYFESIVEAKSAMS